MPHPTFCWSSATNIFHVPGFAGVRGVDSAGAGMANVLNRTRKLLKKVAGKAGESRLGRQVRKVPAPIRKGYLAGMLVPVPGMAETGALIGSGVWAKGAIEHQVRKHTGRPYRMFGHDFPNMKNENQESGNPGAAGDCQALTAKPQRARRNAKQGRIFPLTIFPLRHFANFVALR